MSKSSLKSIITKPKPISVNTKTYRFAADVEHTIMKKEPFAFSLFRRLFTEERVIAVVLCYLGQYYIRILHVHNNESFQDPHGFAYFATNIHPKIEHIVLHPEELRSHRLTYLASGIALPSTQQNVYAFILGNGAKKIPGINQIFAPTTINKEYTQDWSRDTFGSSVWI